MHCCDVWDDAVNVSPFTADCPQVLPASEVGILQQKSRNHPNLDKMISGGIFVGNSGTVGVFLEFPPQQSLEFIWEMRK